MEIVGEDRETRGEREVRLGQRVDIDCVIGAS